MKRVCVPLLTLYLIIGAISAYRAWYQVRKVNLSVTNPVLRPGVAINYEVVSYARTPINVRVELVQNAHTETIATLKLPDNEWAFFDPRNQAATRTTTIGSDVLNHFSKGSAIIRATVIGCEQWTRLPPPVVREVAVAIQH